MPSPLSLLAVAGLGAAAALGLGIIVIIRRLETMSDNDTKLAAEVATLQGDVAAQNTVIASATALINGFAAQLAAAMAAAKSAGVPDDALAALSALHTGLTGNTAALAAAVAANTPAAQTPAPTPDPTPTPAPTPVDPSAPVGPTTEL